MKKGFIVTTLCIALIGMLFVSCDSLVGGNEHNFNGDEVQKINMIEFVISGDIPNWIDEDNLMNSFFSLMTEYEDIISDNVFPGAFLAGNKIILDSENAFEMDITDWIDTQDTLKNANTMVSEYGVTLSAENPSQGFIRMNAHLDIDFLRVKEINLANWEDLRSSLGLENTVKFKDFATDFLDQMNTKLEELRPTGDTATEEEIALFNEAMALKDLLLTDYISITDTGIEFIGHNGGIDIPVSIVNKVLQEFLFVDGDGNTVDPIPLTLSESAKGALEVTLNF